MWMGENWVVSCMALGLCILANNHPNLHYRVLSLCAMSCTQCFTWPTYVPLFTRRIFMCYLPKQPLISEIGLYFHSGAIDFYLRNLNALCPGIYNYTCNIRCHILPVIAALGNCAPQSNCHPFVGNFVLFFPSQAVFKVETLKLNYCD